MLNFLNDVPVELIHESGGEPADEEGFDTHPSVQTRIQAVDLQPDAVAAASHPAKVLLRELDRLEARLMAWEARKRGLPVPQALTWSAALVRFHRPRWDVAGECHEFDGKSVAQLPEIVDASGVELVGAQFATGVRERLQHIAETLCAALERDGWRPDLRAPGRALVMRKGDRRIEPFTAVSRLAWKQIAFFEWEDECAELDVAGLALTAPSLQRA